MSKTIRIIKNFITNPKLRFSYMTRMGLTSWINDEEFLKKEYYLNLGKKLNLECPKTFNEKIQWLKLYDRKAIYTTMVDKYEAKKYVANKIGKRYIIPTIGIYENYNDINFNELPKQFVIKCTHDSGGLIICKNKANFNVNKARKKINKFLHRKFYYMHREWPYKDVKPRIIIEKYMEDSNSKSMRDYKFFCFNGKPKLMYISEGLENHNTASMSFFDMNYKLTDCKRRDYKQLDVIPPKPKNFEKMKELSSVLAKDIPHLRVDWYEIDGKLYFGELTFSTCGGFIPFENDEWDEKLGKYINLSVIKR